MSGHLRLGDADRDRAAAELNEHYAQGRIDADEHAERLDAIWTARVRADLDPIFADLPRPVPARGGLRGGPPGRRHRGAWPLPFLPLAVLLVGLLVALSVVTHLPFWVLIFFVCCGPLGRRAHGWPHGAPVRERG